MPSVNSVTLADVVSFVESYHRPDSIRFEPAWVSDPHTVARMAALADCDTATARVLCACSWGFYQIMGENLVSLGLPFSPIAYCGNPTLQAQFFHDFCAANGVENVLAIPLPQLFAPGPLPVELIEFARVYNGPGDPQRYALALRSAYGHLLAKNS